MKLLSKKNMYIFYLYATSYIIVNIMISSFSGDPFHIKILASTFFTSIIFVFIMWQLSKRKAKKDPDSLEMLNIEENDERNIEIANRSTMITFKTIPLLFSILILFNWINKAQLSVILAEGIVFFLIIGIMTISRAIVSKQI